MIQSINLTYRFRWYDRVNRMFSIYGIVYVGQMILKVSLTYIATEPCTFTYIFLYTNIFLTIKTIMLI